MPHYYQTEALLESHVNIKASLVLFMEVPYNISTAVSQAINVAIWIICYQETGEPACTNISKFICIVNTGNKVKPVKNLAKYSSELIVKVTQLMFIIWNGFSEMFFCFAL